MAAQLHLQHVLGRPISLKWEWADEHGWEPSGPAMVVKMEASLGKDGRISHWQHDIWSYPTTYIGMINVQISNYRHPHNGLSRVRNEQGHGQAARLPTCIPAFQSATYQASQLGHILTAAGPGH